jgi:hypothetical protein
LAQEVVSPVDDEKKKIKVDNKKQSKREKEIKPIGDTTERMKEHKRTQT